MRLLPVVPDGTTGLAPVSLLPARTVAFQTYALVLNLKQSLASALFLGGRDQTVFRQ